MKVFITGGSGFIGRNLIEAITKQGWTFYNYDQAEPGIGFERWIRGDIRDHEALAGAVAECAPDAVIHLAARTDCDEGTTVEEGYRPNTEGTANLLSAVGAVPSVRRLIVVSSQFVCGPGRLPEGDEDYFPVTVYGESKVITEKLTRDAQLHCCWTLVRPTNVWGPHHARYAREFWKIAAKGLYLHPGVPTPTRCYAYVGNVVWQMCRILESSPDVVGGRTFYLGDRPIDIVKWIQGFHSALSPREWMITIPYPLIKAVAVAGDLISRITGKPFYLTSSRLRSMTTEYPAPMEETFRVLGEPPYSLDEGIRISSEWYREQART